jgi:hypothetical protein
VAAVNETTGQRVAIKYLNDDLVRDPEFMDGLRSAAGTLATMDAPHAVRVLDYVDRRPHCPGTARPPWRG